MPRDATLVAEGANTMDISRTVLPNHEARQRLDAGSFGTMGVGAGFAIAAAAVHPERKVVSVQGDSAFGFSAMEVEVACRYRLDITWVVVNNNGIGGGVEELGDPIPPSVYTPRAHYERVIEAFGGQGYYVEKPAELERALKDAIATQGPTVVNVIINPRAQRKPQKFEWLTR
jgi:2-hydroxyacyl-CoA lyase 1